MPTSVLQDAQRRLLQQAAGCDAAGVSGLQLAEPVDVSAVRRARKCALRKMKTCMRTVAQHGRRYFDRLKKSWS